MKNEKTKILTVHIIFKNKEIRKVNEAKLKAKIKAESGCDDVFFTKRDVNT